MTKNSVENTPRPASKKHLARMEKESRQKKFLLISIIAIVAVVVFLVTYGLLDSTVLKQNKPVAKVDATMIKVNDFVKRVQYERLSNIETFVQYAASPYASFFQSSLVEMQTALDNYIQFGSDVLDQMINEAVVANKATELGISVSEEDIDKELERGFGFFPNGTPTAQPTVEYRATSTFSATQLVLVTLTPTPSPEPTETSIPATPTTALAIEGTPGEAMATVVPPTATAVIPTSTATAIPTATEIPPTATAYTREGFEGLKATMVASINEQFTYSESDFRAYVKSLLLNQKVFDHINKDVAVDQEMVWARHILVATEEEAKDILTKLADGQDFSDLAAEFSLDTSNSTSGGDLGWFYKGMMVEEFETAAYALKIGEISQPVKTENGYHIIQVLGHEVRQLTEDELYNQKSANFSKFIEDAKAEMTVKKFDIWAEVAPSTPAIPDAYRIDTTATSQ